MIPVTLTARPGTWQLAALLLGGLCAAAFLIHPGPQFELAPIFLHLYYAFDQPAAALALGIAAIAAFAADRNGRAEALFAAIAGHPRWVAGVAFAIAALGAWFVYHNHALAMDEYAPLLQSRIFAAGHLTGHIPSFLAGVFSPAWFQGLFLHISPDGALASAYWPGLALVMTPFTLLGVPWLCNPVLTAATFAGLARLLEKLIDAPAARGAALIASLASPVILINGMSYYGMPLQLLCAVMFTNAILRGTPGYALAAGFWASLGMTAVNPVPLILYCAPWMLWTLRTSPTGWRTFAYVILGSLPLALVLGLGWKLFLLRNFAAPSGDPGAGISALLSVLQPPSMSLLLARAMALVKLCVWAMPGLIVLAALAYRHPGKRRLSAVFAAAAFLTLAGYLFVPFDQGHGWGYRYFHAAWLTLPVLAAVAMEYLATQESLRQRTYGFLLVASVGALLLALPLRAFQVESFISAHLGQIPPRIAGGARQVVFIDVTCGAYTSDLVQNDPFLRSNEIRLVSQGYQWDAQLAAALGPRPQFMRAGTCGYRWLLE